MCSHRSGGGEPSDIPIDREREVCISWNCEEAVSQQAQGIKKRIHAVLKAKDSSYSRAYMDIREGDRVRYAFGIKYKNQAVYSRYLPLYLKFKSSLEQYTD